MAGRPRNDVWVTCSDIKRIFGVQSGRLTRRGVRSRGESPVEYDLDDFWEKFGGEISRPAPTPSDGSEAPDWKKRKLKAEVLGLEMRNAQYAGQLVPSAIIKPAFTKTFGAVADVLGSTTSRIRRRKPDIDSATLAIVEESLNEARNVAADLNFSEIINSDD